MEELIFSIIGAITGIAGFIFGLVGLFKSRNDTVNAFLSIIESKEFSEARAYVYNNKISLDYAISAQNASYIVNVFHHWGLLAKKRYLPMWVFYGASGSGAIRMYELTKDYIQELRKKHDDDTYGEYFEWLYYKIKRKMKRRNKKYVV